MLYTLNLYTTLLSQTTTSKFNFIYPNTPFTMTQLGDTSCMVLEDLGS